jgi:hypothetical protein
MLSTAQINIAFNSPDFQGIAPKSLNEFTEEKLPGPVNA